MSSVNPAVPIGVILFGAAAAFVMHHNSSGPQPLPSLKPEPNACLHDVSKCSCYAPAPVSRPPWPSKYPQSSGKPIKYPACFGAKIGSSFSVPNLRGATFEYHGIVTLYNKEFGCISVEGTAKDVLQRKVSMQGRTWLGPTDQPNVFAVFPCPELNASMHSLVSNMTVHVSAEMLGLDGTVHIDMSPFFKQDVHLPFSLFVFTPMDYFQDCASSSCFLGRSSIPPASSTNPSSSIPSVAPSPHHHCSIM